MLEQTEASKMLERTHQAFNYVGLKRSSKAQKIQVGAKQVCQGQKHICRVYKCYIGNIVKTGNKKAEKR